MKKLISLILISIIFSLLGCGEKDSNAVALSVDFTWEDYANCDRGLPQMSIGGIPENTKFLKVSMYDHKFGFDHGEVKMVYEGSGIIFRDKSAEITGPCPPPNDPGRYKITIKALDENDIVIGIGSKERSFPEKK
jgi:phosphatidylethanolamine-binding protein (PEBP) family uncharacterized protein